MTLEQLKNVVRESGILVDQNHNFLLSPESYRASRRNIDDLNRMGQALQACLAGIGRIAAIGGDNQFSPQKSALNWVYRALWTGSPHSFRENQTVNPSSTPLILKVDLVPARSGQNFIVEIDGYNERAMGYSILTARLRDVVNPKAEKLPGVATTLAEEIRTRSKLDEAVLIYSNIERFYYPEFRILAESLGKLGVTLHLADETEVEIKDKQICVNGKAIVADLFVYHPFLYFNVELDEWLKSSYKEKRISFLIPPKPFFGSKAVMALLRNDEKDIELESILRTFVPSDALEEIRTHIPPTYLLHRKHPFKDTLSAQGVLKKTVSSGAKGICFSGAPEFRDTLDRAFAENYVYVLQEEVELEQQRIRYFPHGSETAETADCFVRVTAHFIGARGKLADLTITATRDKLVHGGTNSILMGVTVES